METDSGRARNDGQSHLCRRGGDLLCGAGRDAVVGRRRRHAAHRRDGLLSRAGAACGILLAGYAGLVSVGQQAYVGLGGYALFYLTGALDVNVYVALLIAGPFAGLLSIPVSIAVFRLRGAYFAVGTWVVSEVFALAREPYPGARRRLRLVADARHHARDRARPGGPRHDPVSHVSRDRGASCSLSSICCCARATGWR